MKMLSWNAIESAQMTFRLIPKILNPIDVVALLGEQFTVVDSLVLKLRNIQGVIALERVRINQAIRLHLLPNNGEQGVCLYIGYNHCENLAMTL